MIREFFYLQKSDRKVILTLLAVIIIALGVIFLTGDRMKSLMLSFLPIPSLFLLVAVILAIVSVNNLIVRERSMSELRWSIGIRLSAVEGISVRESGTLWWRTISRRLERGNSSC